MYAYNIVKRVGIGTHARVSHQTLGPKVTFAPIYTYMI